MNKTHVFVSLCVVLVVSAVIAYVYIDPNGSEGSGENGENEGTSGKSGPLLNLQNIRFYGTTTKYVEIIIINPGTADAKVEEVYTGTSETNLAKQTSVTYSPSTQIVRADATAPLTIAITYDWTDGTRYYFKVTSETGQTLSFNKVA